MGDNCLVNTVCGQAVPGSVTTLRTSAACAINTWADATGACAANKVCGDQLAVGSNAAVTRLTGASRTAEGTCNACTGGTYAGDDATACLVNTVCGQAVPGSVTTLRTSGDASTTV